MATQQHRSRRTDITVPLITTDAMCNFSQTLEDTALPLGKSDYLECQAN